MITNNDFARFYTNHRNEQPAQTDDRAQHWTTVLDRIPTPAPTPVLPPPAAPAAAAPTITLTAPTRSPSPAAQQRGNSAPPAMESVAAPAQPRTRKAAVRQAKAARAEAFRQAERQRAPKLIAAARHDDGVATFATLTRTGLTPNDRATRTRFRQVSTALVTATTMAIRAGAQETTRAFWDRCTWTEWKKATRAGIAGAPNNDTRQLVFDLSVGDVKFAERLFSKDEFAQRAQIFLASRG